MTQEDKWAGKIADGWASLLLGVGVGTAADITSAATGRALAAPITVAAAAVLTAWRMRTLPSARIPRYGIGLSLALSLIAAMLTVIGPSSLAPYMIFAAVGLTGAAALIQTEASNRPDRLFSILFVGIAVTQTGGANLEVPNWILLVVVVLVLAGMIVADLIDWEPPTWMIQAGVGFAGVGVGVALLAGRQLTGIIVVSLGLTYVAMAVAWLIGRKPFDWIGGVGIGLIAVGIGVAELVGRQLPVGMAFVAGGVAAVRYGVSTFRGQQAAALHDPEPGSSPNLPPLGGQSGDRSGR